MLSEISQLKKEKYYSTYMRFTFIGTVRRMVVARDWTEERMGNYCLMGTELQFYNKKKLQRSMVVMVACYECI